MKHLLIDLALAGYIVRISDGGFAMKESVEITLMKDHPADGKRWYQLKVVHPLEADAFLDNILRDLRDELNMKMGIA